MPGVEEPILKNLQAFVGFARRRVGDVHLAEDVVQDSLVKALAADRKPCGEEQILAWFYRVLCRSIIDLYRRQDARRRALDRFERELPQTPSPTDQRLLCQCLNRLLPSMPGRYGELLREVDLRGKAPAEVAASLGVTKNNLTVRLHRARRHLRELLIRSCGACSKHGCLDCTCAPSGPVAGEQRLRGARRRRGEHPE